MTACGGIVGFEIHRCVFICLGSFAFRGWFVGGGGGGEGGGLRMSWLMTYDGIWVR